MRSRACGSDSPWLPREVARDLLAREHGLRDVVAASRATISPPTGPDGLHAWQRGTLRASHAHRPADGVGELPRRRPCRRGRACGRARRRARRRGRRVMRVGRGVARRCARSIISADSSSAVGFARPLSGDVGRAAVHRLEHRARRRRCSRPGTTPRPPTSPAHRSDTMSPYRFGSTQHVELLGVHHQLHARRVDDALVVLDVGVVARRRARALEEQPVAELHDVGLVDRRDALAPVRARVARRRTPRCASRRARRDDLQALDHARARPRARGPGTGPRCSRGRSPGRRRSKRVFTPGQVVAPGRRLA